MKKLFTYSFLLLTVVCMSQVTINRNNFPRKTGFTDSTKIAVATGVALPTEGAAQVWNYSTLVELSAGVLAYADATADVNFPGALNSYQNNLTFQAFPISSRTYEAIDANGWYTLGRSTVDVTHSIATISGGAKDSLRFPGSNQIYNGRIDAIKFPMTYPGGWTESRIENTSFELTVAAFFINKAPGSSKRNVTQSRQIVGFGKLKIPKSDGSPSGDMDVLLMKVVQTNSDSFFLAGNPAPAPLLVAFGLSQGQTTRDSFYIFYKPDFATPVMIMNLSNTGQVSSVTYRPQAADGTVANKETTASQTNCYPNPANAGQTLTLTTASQIVSEATVKIIDVKGQVFFKNQARVQPRNQYHVSLPEQIATGIYTIQLEDQRGEIIGKAKLFVR